MWNNKEKYYMRLKPLIGEEVDNKAPIKAPTTTIPPQVAHFHFSTRLTRSSRISNLHVIFLRTLSWNSTSPCKWLSILSCKRLISSNRSLFFVEKWSLINIHCPSNSLITYCRCSISFLKASICVSEARDCKSQLENLFKVPINDFCYPFGRCSRSLVNIIKNSGYHTATTMQRGKVNSQTDTYQLPRIPINHRTLPHLFLLKVLTNYEDGRK